MDKLDKLLVIYAFRFLCLVLFVLSTFSLSVSWKSFATLIVFLGSLFYNPYRKPKPIEKKEKTRDIVNSLYPKLSAEDEDREVARAVLKLVSYDAENTPALENFEIIKSQSNCMFAKKAKVWGCPPWNMKLSLEENIFRLIPTFLKFTIVCSTHKLDAFLIELPGQLYGKDFKSFGDALCTVLTVLSDHDPEGVRCMSKSYVGKRGWVFQFNRCTFFITTIAPFYPENHVRYAFGADNCYILFQPELSFAFHDLPPDTVETNWDQPVTVRDKIRVAFRDAGRGSYIPDTVYGPIVQEMLRPIHEEDEIYEWWNNTETTLSP